MSSLALRKEAKKAYKGGSGYRLSKNSSSTGSVNDATGSTLTIVNVGDVQNPDRNSRSASLDAKLTRLFDVVIASAAILVLLPILLLIAIVVGLSSKGPVIFRQQRIGQGGKLFPCLKFRTMVVDAQVRLDELLAKCPQSRAEWDADQKLRKDPRITFVGRFLRKSSLDELPQLFNVLAGQMSIVGPRPIIQAEVVRYGDRFLAYCSCRPGLTGLWQISGRNNISYDARVRLDSFYAARKSLAYDLSICFRTVPALLATRGSF